ncbi:MAG: hypothetical protein KGI50_02590 [Patescibacteria group bacterium]|nr:hypothetical protein [Patescibacteria group bacterium]MDE2438600.1 hypothetical protein [Patescibacteria group bacterium]
MTASHEKNHEERDTQKSLYPLLFALALLAGFMAGLSISAYSLAMITGFAALLWGLTDFLRSNTIFSFIWLGILGFAVPFFIVAWSAKLLFLLLSFIAF